MTTHTSASQSNMNAVDRAETGCNVFEVLAHTDELLIVQTNAGELLNSDGDSGNIENEKVSSFGQFNLGLHVKDEPKQVLDNRAKLLSLINQYLARSNTASDQHIHSIHWLNQFHSNDVVVIGSGQNTNQRKPLSLTAPSADAQVTADSGTALAIMTADCVPIALHDKTGKQVAAIHAGWQGLANGVIASTYDTLVQSNETDDAQIQAWIGVCISQPCYEVSVDVVNKLLVGCADMGMDVESVREQIVGQHDNPDKAWLDLPLLAKMQLECLGIQVMSHASQAVEHKSSQSDNNGPAYGCSYANHRYYSYRRMTHLSEASTGRMALLVMRLGGH